MKILCNDLWKQILFFIGFSISDICFSLTCKFFNEIFFPLWLKGSFVCIPALKLRKPSNVQQSKRWVAKYAWCINELSCNYSLDFTLPRLSYLQFADVRFISLSKQHFPILQHLEIIGSSIEHVNINELSLISLCIYSNMDVRFKSSTLQFLSFHTYFYYDLMIMLLKNLPNLKYIQVNDGRKQLEKAFPHIHIDTENAHFGRRWLQFVLNKMN